MEMLICLYDRKNLIPQDHMNQFSGIADINQLDCLSSVHEMVTHKVYQLIVLVVSDISTSSFFQTKFSTKCPFMVLTGVQNMTSESITCLIELFGNMMKEKFNPMEHDHSFTESLNYIEQNLYDSELSLERVAASIYVSRFHYSRMFQRYVGTGFKEYVIHNRMRRAVQLLKNGYPVTEVCYAVGYGDLTHFSRIFKRIYGVNPSAYRFDKTGAQRALV